MVFDVDGTLMDTNYHHAIAWFRALRQRNVTVPVWRIHRAIGMGGDRLVEHVAGQQVEAEHGDWLRDRWKQEYEAFIHEVVPLTGATDLLAAAKESGLRVALAGSGDPDHVSHYPDVLDARDITDDWTTAADVDIDLGCGPGRLVRALIDRGLVALGVDSSARAIHDCAERGAPSVLRDLFSPLPGEGSSQHDGNIGIGGDPPALLRRAAGLLCAGQRADRDRLTQRRTMARRRPTVRWPSTGPWFPWAVVGLNATSLLARLAGLTLTCTHRTGHRYFAELHLAEHVPPGRREQ